MLRVRISRSSDLPATASGTWQIKLEVAVTPQQLYRGAADKATIVGYLEDRGFSLADTELQSRGQEENLTFVRR